MLVVLVRGHVTRADGRVEGRVRVGDEVGVGHVGGQVVGRGDGRGVAGGVALVGLGGDHHPPNPSVVLQHLGGEQKEMEEEREEQRKG